MDAANPTLQAQTVIAWISAWRNLDATGVMDAMADNYQHQFLPSTLGGNGEPLSKEQFSAHVRLMLDGMFEKLEIEVLDSVEMPGKMALQGKTRGTLKETGEVYQNEWMWILHFEHTNAESGKTPKILLVKDFLDSHATKEFKWPERMGEPQA